MRGMTGRGKTNLRIWKNILKKAVPVEEGLAIKPRDPSLRSQLRDRQNLLDSVRIESYLEACRKAPNASEGTKRKWKRALGL